MELNIPIIHAKYCEWPGRFGREDPRATVWTLCRWHFVDLPDLVGSLSFNNPATWHEFLGKHWSQHSCSCREFVLDSCSPPFNSCSFLIGCIWNDRWLNSEYQWRANGKRGTEFGNNGKICVLVIFSYFLRNNQRPPNKRFNAVPKILMNWTLACKLVSGLFAFDSWRTYSYY